MKLELKEIEIIETEKSDSSFTNFKSFNDILDCFERQQNLFQQLEKDLTISSSSQILFTFSFLLFLHLSFTLSSLVLKVAISYFFHKFIKKMKLEFSFSEFIYSVLSFSSAKFKNRNHKIKLYQEEKKNFLNEFFSFPVNKEIIFKYLYSFYHDNEYRLSSEVFSEIDSIKASIEKEHYESAFEQLLHFKKRVQYIKELDQY